VPPRTDPREITFFGRHIRCVLVHDHVLLRQGLRRLLEDEPDFNVIDEAGNAAEGLRKVHEHQPDVLVADAATFGMPPREAELLVERESPRTKIVFLTVQDPRSSPVDDSQTSGTAKCTVRQTSAQELLAMVRNTCPGSERNVTASIPANPPVKAWPQDVVRPDAIPFPTERTLTTREREVMKLLAEGKTVRAAAMTLGLSSKTVDAHKFNLMRKLGIHNKAELVMWAIQKRVVKLPANF
jgi:two-component system, NarL family, response regulator NreC